MIAYRLVNQIEESFCTKSDYEYSTQPMSAEQIAQL